ncbi:hypothetical protein BH23ACT5_BH23ACT5_11370 [soil metagenome]
MAEARRLIRLAAVVEAAADLPPGPVAVALSGGADSAALLWLCRQLDRQVRAIHVDHGLGASPLMVGAAQDVADSVDLDLEVAAVEVPGGASFEAMARQVRYRALLSRLEESESLLTAHTSDDVAETVLDHLFRSSGPDGLAGIPARRGRIARPFLEVTRAQARELATLAGLPWIDDPANADRDPLRNRIRNRLIPHLEASYSGSLRRALSTSARLLAAENELVESLARVPIVTRPGSTEVAASVVSTAHPVVAARIVRQLLRSVGLQAASVEAVEGTLDVAAGRRRAHQPGAGVEVRRRGPMLVAHSRPTPVAHAVELTVPGTTIFGEWRIDGGIDESPPVAMPLGSGWMVADADRVGPLRVEAVIDHPEAARHMSGAVTEPGLHPVVMSESGPVWIPGVIRFGLGWVDAATDRYLVLRTRLTGHGTDTNPDFGRRDL